MTHPVLDQLPLWVEGDLEPQDHATVEAHLADCPACRQAADHWRTRQRELREALASPFAEADEDRLRRKVMNQIRSESAPRPIHRLTLRPTLLAACAAALLVTTLVWRQAHATVASPALEQPALVTPAPVTPQALPMQAQANPTPAATYPPQPHAARESLSLPQEEPARIEIQTADPTIRIIWLAQAKPLSDTKSNTQEAL